MHVSYTILVATVVLWLQINVEGLARIESCAASSSPLVCVQDGIKIDSNISSELNNLLLSLQNETLVHCDNVETKVKFFLYLLETSAALNSTDRSTVDTFVLGEGINCSSYAILFVTNETAKIIIGQNASELLNEEAINIDLKSLKKVNIEERAFEAIDALKLAITKGDPSPSQAGGLTWVNLVGLGFIGVIVGAMVFWAWKQYKGRRGLIPVSTAYE